MPPDTPCWNRKRSSAGSPAATTLRLHLPGVEVRAHGNRVTGRSHGGSDLDLVLRGPGLETIPTRQLGKFVDGIRDSTIAFPVDARDWASLPARFRREIERDHVVVAGPRRDIL